MEKTCEVRLNGQTFSLPFGAKLSRLPLSDLPCGGHGKCGKCKVVARGQLSEPTEKEKSVLTEAEIASGIRLACQTLVYGNATVTALSSAPPDVLTDGSFSLPSLAPAFSSYGVAFDLGTTTLAARLYDRNGMILAKTGDENPECAFGADVITRIEAALHGKAAEIAERIAEKTDELLVRLAEQAKIDAREIDGLCITGNTAMLYLFTQTPTAELSHAPFRMECGFGKEIAAKLLGLKNIDENARVYFPPCISAFVGADTVSAILASDLCRLPDGAMLCDIGTNGEMAIAKNGKLFVCSTAAGPAFEGVGISAGMRGTQGAIDRVSAENGALRIHVIGDGTPIGICGSGLVDAVASLRKLGTIDETGFTEEDTLPLVSSVALTAKDVRMVQLAKSAICAGLITLLKEANLREEDVPVLLIAGGFGTYLDTENAACIGLIPRTLAARSRAVGNAALDGASLLLLDESKRKTAETLAEEAVTVDLSTSPVFNENYVAGMLFPETDVG